MDSIKWALGVMVPYFQDWDWPVIIPKIYREAHDEEQRIKWILCHIAKLIDYANSQTSAINGLDKELEALKAQFEKFISSGFDDYYAEQVAKWINEHLLYIYDHTIKQIYFALDDTGHLIAYVPESWDDIMFSTPLVYNEPTYGRLILSYNV